MQLFERQAHARQRYFRITYPPYTAVITSSARNHLQVSANSVGSGRSSQATETAANARQTAKGTTANRPAFRNLSMIASSVVARGKDAACANKKPLKTRSRPARPTAAPSTATIKSFELSKAVP